MADTVASELDKLHSAVADKPTVLASLEELFRGICARMNKAIRMGIAADASDAHLAPFQDLLHGLTERGPDLAAAVMANTPHRDEHPDHEAHEHDEHVHAAPVPEGVSTADDTPLPGHAAEPPWDERVKEPILPEVGSNYMQAPLAPGNPMADAAAPADPAHDAAPGPAHQNDTPREPPGAEDKGTDDGGASVESTPKAPENAAHAHDAHEAQAEENTAAHAADHDAKKPDA